jgi:hypothetical protein
MYFFVTNVVQKNRFTSFRHSALESNDVLIAQHWRGATENKAGKSDNPCRLNSSPEMLSVYSLASIIGLGAATNCDDPI